jgi:hypothetical protein
VLYDLINEAANFVKVQTVSNQKYVDKNCKSIKLSFVVRTPKQIVIHNTVHTSISPDIKTGTFNSCTELLPYSDIIYLSSDIARNNYIM